MERIIQMAAELPIHDKVSDKLTNDLLSQLWDDLQHPPMSYLGYEYAFRKADGSNNNILWPHIGASFQPYGRTVTPKKMQPAARPDAGVVFDSVLARKKFTPHPNGISSVLFYLASIIIHDCFHTSHSDFAISETSSYLDLAPLYGSNLEQQMSVRTREDGRLKLDCFADSRILGFPPGVGCLLIMFNRFHNHVVANLAQIDEHQRFSSILNGRSGFKGIQLEGNEFPATPEQRYDEALFQTARLVTTGLYVNIILKDYVRTILNLNRVDTLWDLDPRSDEGKAIFGHKIPEATGNQVAAEFNLVYRWHSCVSERDAKWTEQAMDLITNGQKDLSFNELVVALARWSARLPRDPLDRQFDTLQRQPDGKYSDDDLASTWTSSVEDVAGAFGAGHVPPVLKFVEVLGMIQARSWNLASLNEFRAHFKLKPHESFKSINSDPYIAEQLERLYGHPDNVEMYPGLVVEEARKAMKPGSGLCASFTASRAILSDAVSLVRSDRFHTVDYTPQNLTNWGFNAADTDLDINHGCVLYKLLINGLPNHLSKNSIYAHYPLVIPTENKIILQAMKRDQLYDFDRPASKPAMLYKSPNAINGTAVSDVAKLDNLWTQRAGSFGGPTEKARTATSFAKAFMANETWKATTTKYYTDAMEKSWKEKQYDLGGYQTIDLVGDVLNAAHLGFITSILGISSHVKSSEDGILATFGNVFEHAYGDPQPNSLSGKVRDATQWLASTIEKQVSNLTNISNQSREAQLGSTALLQLTEGNSDAKKVAWQDVLPAAALIMNILCRISAQTAEFLLDDKTRLAEARELATQDSSRSLEKLARETTRNSSNLAIAMRSVSKEASGNKAEHGEVVMLNPISNTTGRYQDGDQLKVDRDESAYSVTAFGPEVELAYQITIICNTVMTSMLARTEGLERMPGEQGRLKQVKDEAGHIKYMNAEETEYVPYPISMKVRWKAQKQEPASEVAT